MKYLITKERIFYILAVTLLCIIMLVISGIFNSTMSITSISGTVYDNGSTIEHTKTVISVVLSFWLGLLTPIVLIKTK